MIISITRLRLRSWHYLLPFMLHNVRNVLQLRTTSGFRDGRLLTDKALAFWTVTRWTDEDTMLHWRNSGAHAKSMPMLQLWCDEALIARWQTDGESVFPAWEECHRRLEETGRLVTLQHSSGSQDTRNIPLPRTTIAFSFRHV